MERDRHTGFQFRALEVFVAVEEAGSMASAAKRLSASPSAISQQIAALEATIGARLFDRNARPIGLTPVGLRLRYHARRILDVVGEARADLMELNLSSLPTLRLAIVDDLDSGLTPELVAELKDRYPQCLVEASSGASRDIVDALKRRHVDIAVAAALPDDTGSFEIHPLLREPFVLIAARDMLDTDADIIDQLLKRPFVSYNRKLALGQAIEQQMRRLKLDPPQRFIFNSSRSVFAMVVKSRGWALTTPLCILDSTRFRDRIDAFPLPFAGFSRKIWLIAHHGELGHLPENLAATCRDKFEGTLLPEAREILPWSGDALRVLAAETLRRPIVSNGWKS